LLYELTNKESIRFKQGHMFLFDPDEIERLRTVYNNKHSKEKPIPKNGPNAVWAELKRRLHGKCTTGGPTCIVSELTSRPRAPASWSANRTEWLSSDDIDKLEREYAKVHEDYHFVGCVPIDFDLKSEMSKCIVSTLCSMKLDTLYKKGVRRVGIVFNTDVHDGPGQHWIAAFLDIRPELQYPRMTYFDSFARYPEKEIQRLMFRWKDQWDAHGGPKMRLTYNKTRHQFKESECGMYCLYFHRACLLDIPMDKRVSDDDVNALRDLAYRNNKK
jgi:hypothetical protein